MFFIAGLTTRDKTVDRGRFRCPNEDAERRYRHVRSRRWFTLFFIPLLPLNTQSERVRCDGCGTIYGPDVVRHHPARSPR